MSSTRRGFLKTSAAALAGLASTRVLSAKEEGDFNGFTVGIQSYTFRKFNLEQALKRTNDLGLKYAEFYNGHVPIFDACLDTGHLIPVAHLVKKLVAVAQVRVMNPRNFAM